ncbi:DUF2293 domain-containing protein [Hyalangium sp.]|uniref:DUF2293 domain-containing protein n=1 Tax=Hyalangium sp. TaxID=2028555 RepID=UPI002D47ECCA|nr:DUF2293 domain-containing protein [Hyalangium sp.]HYH97078.1 DUF2293 domain-containing protein [Hyalangium sp.]
MPDSLTVAPTSDARRVRAPDGTLLTPPPGWALLPPGDAGLTRRVKAAGPSWTVVEKKGRKTFSHGIWAPEAHIAAARAALEAERATPAYARRRASDQARREREQAEYEVDFANAVLRFLSFAPAFTAHAKRLAVLVAVHATPVGSGTVARTERIPLERRAEAAVIAWLRHQTTGYDDLRIARVKGARREVRRELAELSRGLLDVHRRDVPHSAAGCPLCTALEHPRASQ